MSGGLPISAIEWFFYDVWWYPGDNYEDIKVYPYKGEYFGRFGTLLEDFCPDFHDRFHKHDGRINGRYQDILLWILSLLSVVFVKEYNIGLCRSAYNALDIFFATQYTQRTVPRQTPIHVIASMNNIPMMREPLQATDWYRCPYWQYVGGSGPDFDFDIATPNELALVVQNVDNAVQRAICLFQLGRITEASRIYSQVRERTGGVERPLPIVVANPKSKGKGKDHRSRI
jgi:hypothetical protein